MNASRLLQVLAGERPLRRVEKGGQQGIFALRQRDRSAVGIGQAPAAPIEPPSIESISTSLRIAGPRCARRLLSSQDGPDARQQFPKAERFGDAVVRTELEADDPIDFVSSLTDHDDNRDVRVGPNFSQKIEPVTEP